jgi:hypothetical protein
MHNPAYLLIGDGRLARHLAEYSRLLGVEMTRWARSSGQNPVPQLESATHILLAIADDGIAEFYDRWRDLASTTTLWVHFSGARVFPGIAGAHPLMTFGSRLYDLQVYSEVPFILERGGPYLGEILPGFPNPSYEIATEKRALYHAWAVLATSAVSGTWREYRRMACEEFGLPESALKPFLEQTAENALNLEEPLTGPIARNDLTTIQSNLRALEGSPFERLYRTLLEVLGKDRI